MKISHSIGTFALACATAFGCSGASTSTGGLPLSESNASGGDDGGGTASSGSGGSSNSGSSSGTASTGSSGASSSGSSGSSGSAPDSGAAADGAVATGDSSADNDPETNYAMTETITMDPFTVPAGEEVYYCQSFADPWSEQVSIRTYQLSMSAGSHHMFAFYETDATNGAVAPCPEGGLTFGAFTFTSQTPQVTQTYPAGVGATIPQGTGFNMMAHYLNTTSSTLTANVTLTMYVAKPGVITNNAGVIFLNNTSLTVPSTGQPVVSTDTYTLPQDVYIMTSSSHMHKFGTNFISTASSGQTLYTTTQWDEPKPEVYSPPLELTSGTTITWSCTDVNTTGSTLTFGESAETNVMCIAVDVFYPVSDVNDPVLGSAISGIL